MNRLPALLRRLRMLFVGSCFDRDLDEELRLHRELRERELLESGAAPNATEAHYAAHRALGNALRLREESRDAWGWRWLEHLSQDLRYGGRMLRRNPGFTAVAVLTLALGIGANTAIFSVVEGVVLAPLPYREPDRLVMVMESNQHFSEDAISYPNFLDWQRSSRSFEQISAVMIDQGFDLTHPGTAEHLNGNCISYGFFSTLGVSLILGREFTPQEDTAGGAPVVVISSRLWRNHFAASPAILGHSVTLNGVDYAIIGVAPPDFPIGSAHADVYTPIAQGDPLILNSRGSHDAMVSIARLNPGVIIAQAQAEMTAIQQHLDQLYPDTNGGTGAAVFPLKRQLVGDVRGTLLLLLSAVGLVLLIACANVANLLLARSAARSREFALRSALGASRTRIVRQLIAESVLLSIAGGSLGLLLAKWGVNLALAAMPQTLPRAENIGVNASVLVFAFGVSIAVGILFGLAPALKSSKLDPQAALKEGARGSTSAHHRAQHSLVVVQMALTLVLLVGAGLLFRTIRRLWLTDPGFDTSHLITFKVGLSPSAAKGGAAIHTAFLQLLDRIRAIPGVQAADLSMLVPLTADDNDNPFWLGSEKPALIQNAPRTLVFDTGPDYLRTMGISLLRGRFFTPEDTAKSQCVVVVDDVFVQMYFPGKDPLGQPFTFGFPLRPWGPCPIIGVVGHVRHWGLDERSGSTTRAESYYPIYQAPDNLWPLAYSAMHVIIRTPLDSATVLPAIRAAVYGGASDQTVYDVQTMQGIVSTSMASQRFPMILLGAFAALALLLASVGIYGVISYSASQRVHEIGIRMALGAEKRDVLRMVIGQGLRLALAGVAIGSVAALILARILTSFSHLIYGVGTSDPATFVAVSLLLAAVAIVACYVPAHRAASADPMVALRHE